MLYILLFSSCTSSVWEKFVPHTTYINVQRPTIDPTKLHMTRISAGSFVMGCTTEQRLDCDKDERPHFKAIIDRDFSIGTYEVTQGLYERIMGNNPSFFSNCGLDCPVETVRWYDAILFTNTLNESLGLQKCYSIDEKHVSFVGVTCQGYRLPTEAEWEYVARAKQEFMFSGGQEIDQIAWYINNSFSQTHPVGQKSDNLFAVYDMSGNVLEWVWDWKGTYNRETKRNPTGAQDGLFRVARGGSWSGQTFQMRVSYRYTGGVPDRKENFIGFRLAKSE